MAKRGTSIKPEAEQRMGIPKPEYLDELMKLLDTPTQQEAILKSARIVKELSRFFEVKYVDGIYIGLKITLINKEGKEESFLII